jgi:ATP-dependent Clp protease ATP-binding subunit ClpA
MPMSDDVVHVLSVAMKLKQKRQTEKVEPLHLLAAGLGEKSNKAARIFLDAGITQKTVLEAIREGK